MTRRELRTHVTRPYEDASVCLHFIGDMLCARHSEIGYHRNPGFEICLIPSGKGLFKIDERMYPVGNDQLFLTKAPQVHGGWPSSDAPFRILYLCVSVKEGAACSDPFWADVHRRLEAISHPVCADSQQLLQVHARLMREAGGHAPDRDEVIRTLLALYFLLFLRNQSMEGHPVVGERSASAVIRYMDAHSDQDLRLSELAAAHHMSVSALTRSFRRETGFSVMEYHQVSRIERAKKVLADTPRSVSDIAAELRFASIHHFSHAFKAMVGLSPSAFRKLNRQPEDWHES